MEINPEHRYYQRVIINIIQVVLESYSNILLNEEIATLEQMLTLESQTQRLLFRLLMRQNDQILVSKLNYEDINSLAESIEALKLLNYISYNDLSFSSGHSSSNLFRITKKDNLKSIAKTLRLSIGGMGKQEIITKIISEKTTQSTFIRNEKKINSDNGSDNNDNGNNNNKRRLSISFPVCRNNQNDREIILRDIIREDVIMVNKSIYNIWLQALSLFFLTKPSNDPPLVKLTDAILVDLDKRQYPPYSCNFTEIIFKDRDEWMEYNRALNLEETLGNNQMMADEIYLNILQDGWLMKLVSMMNSVVSLQKSYFLKRFSAKWVQIRILDQIVAIWEGKKRFKEAIDLLELLLSQKEYCLGRRGKWWDRLILNLDYHLNLDQIALNKCDEALSDSYLGPSNRFSIIKRRKKLLISIKKKKKNDNDNDKRRKIKKGNNIKNNGKGDNINDMNDMNDNDNSLLAIERRIIADNLISSSRSKLQYELKDGSIVSVEEYALDHYKRELNWINGLHSEASFFLTIFGLVFWDILFDDKSQPNVFMTPFQDAPLDLRTDAFYLSRKEAIDQRLIEIETLQKREMIIQLIIDTYYSYYGCICNGLQWDLLPLSELISLFEAFPSSLWSVILRILAEDFRGHRAGLPDLILWNDDRIGIETGTERVDHHQNRRLLLVEVKSKNDRISDAQHNWIRILMENGANVEICKVIPNSNQKSNSN